MSSSVQDASQQPEPPEQDIPESGTAEPRIPKSEGPEPEPPPECRICLEVETSSPLIAPCQCRGTAKWVHPECLARWREECKGDGYYRCEQCKAFYHYARWFRLAGSPWIRGAFSLVFYFIVVILSSQAFVWLAPSSLPEFRRKPWEYAASLPKHALSHTLSVYVYGCGGGERQWASFYHVQGPVTVPIAIARRFVVGLGVAGTLESVVNSKWRKYALPVAVFVSILDNNYPSPNCQDKPRALYKAYVTCIVVLGIGKLAIDIALLTRRLAIYIGRIGTRSVVHRDT